MRYVSEVRFQYRGVEIVVKRGDITEEEVDAIVNPANSLMVMGGGVAGAIKRRGGEEIEKEAMKYAPVPIGQAVVTSAGKLRAKYVIHAPTMERPAMRTSLDKVAKAVQAALRAAEERGLESLAFPGMGTGVGGLPVYDAVKTMCHVIREHLDKGSRLRRIHLVAYTEEDYREFVRAAQEVFGGTGQ